MSTVTNNTTTNNAGSSQTRNASSALNGTLNDFLKLLTVQLQNQDPTEPADTNDITQQIASLSQVEQQINTNTNLEKLITMFSGGQVSNAVSYIGKQVDAPGNQDASNKDIAAKTYTTGLVSSVDIIDGVASLSMGLGLSVPLADVISVRAISNVVPENPDEGDDTADAGDDAADETAAS